MLTEIKSWYEVSRASLSELYRAVHKNPARISLMLGSVAPTKWVALQYIQMAQREIGDLAILALFAAFEQSILDHFENLVTAMLKRTKDPLKRRILKGQEQLRKPRKAPIRDILEYYKAIVDPDLVGQVKQILDYRNWVAHGKRGPMPINVTPEIAFERLNKFLEALP